MANQIAPFSPDKPAESLTETWYQNMWNRIAEYVINPETWVTVGIALVKIIVIIVAAKLLVRIINTAVNQVLKQRENGRVRINKRRAETLKKLINNIASYSIYFIAGLLILGQMNFNLGPVLASAGILGLAVGFGAQNLVRDIISGFFIIFEDQFAVGDTIATKGFMGEVQEIGLRITKIKSWTGEVHIIPNGSITEVTNYSIENSIAVLDISIAYEEDVNAAIQSIEEIVRKRYMEIEEIVKPPEVLGIQNLAATEVIIRVTAECKPMAHYSAARKLRQFIKNGLDEKGIEIPYPRLVTIQRNEAETV